MPEQDKLSAIFAYLQTSPITGLALTLGIYCLAMSLFAKSRYHPLLNPVVVSVITIITVLVITGTSYEQYFAGGGIIHFLLGPATVALAIPLYQQLPRIKQLWLPIVITLFSSVVISGLSAVGLSVYLGASFSTQMSLAPKSVTAPVAMGISEILGGIPSLTAALTVATGLIGALIGTKVFSLLNLKDDAVKGIALGLTSHGIGSARAFQLSHEMGAFAGLAMALATFTTAFLLPWLLSAVGIL